MVMVAGAVAVSAIVLGGRLAAPGAADANHLNFLEVPVDVELVVLNLTGQVLLPGPGPESFFDVFVTIDCGGNATTDPDGARLIPGGPPWQTSVTGTPLSEDFTPCTVTPLDLPGNFIPDSNDPPFRLFDQDFPGSTTFTVIEIPAPTPDPEEVITPTPENGDNGDNGDNGGTGDDGAATPPPTGTGGGADTGDSGTAGEPPTAPPTTGSAGLASQDTGGLSLLVVGLLAVASAIVAISGMSAGLVTRRRTR